MKFHAYHINWQSRSELVCLIGFATGRVGYHPGAKWLYSFRLFLLFFKIEILWETGLSNARPVRTDGPPRDSGTHEAVVGLRGDG